MNYQFNISQTLNNKVEYARLESEIRASAIVIALDRIDGSDFSFTCVFKSALDANDQATLLALVQAHTGDALNFAAEVVVTNDLQLAKRTAVQDVPMVAVYKQEGTSGTIISYDWTRKQTWYEKSVRVTGEALTLDSGLVYNSANTYWIDLNHGFLTDEDDIKAPYLPKVYDNGVQLVEDQDFTINYVTGKVTLNQAPAGPVTADYSYATISTFTVAPSPGKVLMIDHTELQFSKNVILNNSSIDFDIYVYNPYDLPNKVLYKKKRYKNIRDIINGANLGQGFIPAVAGLQHDVIVFPFNYVTTQPIDSSVGAEIRVSISDHQPFTGEFATVTFYVHSVESV